MNKPTPAEITAEIAAIEQCKTYVPKLTNLNFDNHAAFDAMIEEMKSDSPSRRLPHPQESTVLEKLTWEANAFRHGVRHAPSLDYASHKPSA